MVRNGQEETLKGPPKGDQGSATELFVSALHAIPMVDGNQDRLPVDFDALADP